MSYSLTGGPCKPDCEISETHVYVQLILHKHLCSHAAFHMNNIPTQVSFMKAVLSMYDNSAYLDVVSLIAFIDVQRIRIT